MKCPKCKKEDLVEWICPEIYDTDKPSWTSLFHCPECHIFYEAVWKVDSITPLIKGKTEVLI